MSRCLRCYEPLPAGEERLHPSCSRAVFGVDRAPRLSLPSGTLVERVTVQLRQGRGLTGVQRKFSGELRDQSRRLALTQHLSGYIVKPQTDDYPHLLEVEALTMRLAEAAGLSVAPSTLLETDEGELVYVTRRVDRASDGYALRQEDMAQITDRLTEHKYRGSHEQVGKAIASHSDRPALDLAQYFRAVAFCFLVGNNDAHLKNWSLTQARDRAWSLTPLYDLVAVRLVLSERDDPEELAITLNGRKRKFTGADFSAFAKAIGVPPGVARGQLKRLERAVGEWAAVIERSFVSPVLQAELIALIEKRLERLSSGR